MIRSKSDLNPSTLNTIQGYQKINTPKERNLWLFTNIGDFKQETLTPLTISRRKLREQQKETFSEQLHIDNTNRTEWNATLIDHGDIISSGEDNTKSESIEPEKLAEHEGVRNTSRLNTSNIKNMFGDNLNGLLQQQQQLPIRPKLQAFGMIPQQERESNHPPVA